MPETCCLSGCYQESTGRFLDRLRQVVDSVESRPAEGERFHRAVCRMSSWLDVAVVHDSCCVRPVPVALQGGADEPNSGSFVLPSPAWDRPGASFPAAPLPPLNLQTGVWRACDLGSETITRGHRTLVPAPLITRSNAKKGCSSLKTLRPQVAGPGGTVQRKFHMHSGPVTPGRDPFTCPDLAPHRREKPSWIRASEAKEVPTRTGLKFPPMTDIVLNSAEKSFSRGVLTAGSPTVLFTAAMPQLLQDSQSTGHKRVVTLLFLSVPVMVSSVFPNRHGLGAEVQQSSYPQSWRTSR